MLTLTFFFNPRFSALSPYTAKDHLLIVSHAEFLNGLMAVLLDLKMSPEGKFRVHLCEVVRLAPWKGRSM